MISPNSNSWVFFPGALNPWGAEVDIKRCRSLFSKKPPGGFIAPKSLASKLLKGFFHRYPHSSVHRSLFEAPALLGGPLDLTGMILQVVLYVLVFFFLGRGGRDCSGFVNCGAVFLFLTLKWKGSWSQDWTFFKYEGWIKHPFEFFKVPTKTPAWNAKCPIFSGNVTPKTSNYIYCLKNGALGFPAAGYFRTNLDLQIIQFDFASYNTWMSLQKLVTC